MKIDLIYFHYLILKWMDFFLSENPCHAKNQVGLLNKTLSAKREMVIITNIHLFSASVFVE